MTTQPLPNYLGYGAVELLSMLCPSVLTQVTASVAYLESVQVSLASSASVAATVTVQDNQPTPIFAMSISLQPGDVQFVKFEGRTMAGGISVLSDTPNAVSITMRWRRP